MTPAPADPLDDAVLAARLFVLAPSTFKGMVLRGSSPAREALVAALPLRRLPGDVDDERLLGGIDLAASLSAGRPVRQTGLIEEARGGALIAGMAERMDAGVAGRLAQALDEGGTALLLLDDAAEPEEAPPASLTERLAFLCDLSASRRWQGVELAPAAGRLADVAPLAENDLRALAATAEALGVENLRALIFAGEAARKPPRMPRPRQKPSRRDKSTASWSTYPPAPAPRVPRSPPLWVGASSPCPAPMRECSSRRSTRCNPQRGPHERA